jgi:putative SOS response-associated peptidase YedK
MAMREVSTMVNNVANNGPELIEPAGPGNQPVGLF